MWVYATVTSSPATAASTGRSIGPTATTSGAAGVPRRSTASRPAPGSGTSLTWVESRR
ncbi:hypothetical protein ACN27G_31910 [Plantactinospora sp. WMMB334]|uniref:hypothetical protein n=1 Tax=Plantactinospora sp. WMMB334 TaxID=3404119 RepID=UPI003B929F30